MATKRFSWMFFSSLQPSSQNPPESHRQCRDRSGREPSPRSETEVREDRERERDREGDWSRQREMQRMKDRKREKEREIGQSYREERDCLKIPQQREKRYAKSEKEPLREGALSVWKERWREVGTTSREREDGKRTRKVTAREAEVGRRYVERPRGAEREDFERVNERDTLRYQKRDELKDAHRYRENDRQRDWERDGLREEYRSNGRRLRERERDCDQRRERGSEFSPRYRKRDERVENEQRSERERVRDRERERVRQLERESAYNTNEGKRLVEREREHVSDREGWERKQEGQRDTKSEGDSEGETQRERVFEKQSLKKKHSRSEGDNEVEMIRERLRESDRLRENKEERKGDRYTDRYRPKVTEDRARERYREREEVRDSERYRDRHEMRERDQETYKEKHRRRKEWREPETGREGPNSQATSERLKHREEADVRERKKHKEERERCQLRERCREERPKSPRGIETENKEEIGTDIRGGVQSYNHVYSEPEERGGKHRTGENAEETESSVRSDVERKKGRRVESSRGRKAEGERKQRREWTEDIESERVERLRHKRMWIEPWKTERREEASEGQEETCPEREGAIDQLSDRYAEKDLNEGRATGLRREDIFMERGENRETGQGEGDTARDKDDEDEDDKWLNREFYEDRDMESENSEESERSWQEDEDGSVERDDEMDSTDENESEEKAGDKLRPSESDTESTMQEEEEERKLSIEDGFVTVSSGGEEEQEEKFDDCKEFWESEGPNEDVQPAEGKSMGQMEAGGEEVGYEHHEEKDLCETYSEQERNRENDSPSEGEQECIERRNLEEGVDVKTDIVEEETEREVVLDTEGDENERQDPKVTLFCVIGQTLPRSRTQGGPPDQKEMEESSEKEEESGTEIKESNTEQEEKEKDMGDSPVYNMEHSDDSSGIHICDIAPKETDQYSEKDGSNTYSENADTEARGNITTGKSETETESLCKNQHEAIRETEPYLETASEAGKEIEHEVTLTGDRKTRTESYSTEDRSHAGLDALTRVEEQCKEEPCPELKPAGDVGTEIAGSSEDHALEQMELQKSGELYLEVQQQMDAWPTQDSFNSNAKELSPAVTNQEVPEPGMHTDVLTDTNNGDQESPEAQGNTGRDTDTVESEREEKTQGLCERPAHVESYPNPCIIIETEGQTGAGRDPETTARESDTGAQAYQDDYPLTKTQLSKSNSCPSPVHSPSKDHVNVSLEDKEGGRTVTERGATECTSSFRDLGKEVRSRRRGFRKTEKSGDVEEGVGRDRRTRIFSISDDDDELSYSWSESELRKLTETIQRSKKRNSKFYNSQLYQQYSEVVQNQEILRQCRSDTLSSGSPLPSPPPARRPLPPLPAIPHPNSLIHSNSLSNISTLSAPVGSSLRPPSPRLSISLSQSPTLWQDLPGVRNSRELSELNEDQRRLQEVRFEVVTSEASYCKSLDIVVGHFLKSKQLGALLTAQDKTWLFSRLVDVRAVSHSFLLKLEEQVEKDIMHFTVCDIIMHYCPRFRSVYVPYLTNQSYQDKTYQRLMAECPGFRRVVENLERNPVCQRLPLRSFLVLPFQRITRLKLLVQNIVKRTAPNTMEDAQAIKALKLLEKIIQESNDSITQMKSIESLVSLSSKVDFECRRRQVHRDQLRPNDRHPGRELPRQTALAAEEPVPPPPVTTAGPAALHRVTVWSSISHLTFMLTG
ncbi:trichohyalin isoform X2 [Scleropages formosus]|uniref:trichohyalin isoform X2 n=1 Tax=Scleropages formosus TaxID=113540 RepID=UPI000878100E|nr:trichohyalin-like isoform X2 [Scleropages formosus]